jgi:hypothetical protein
MKNIFFRYKRKTGVSAKEYTLFALPDNGLENQQEH